MKLTTPASQDINLGYYPTGRLASILFPNGVVSAYQYDGNGRLATLSYTLGANPSFASFGYMYNPVGTIMRMSHMMEMTFGVEFHGLSMDVDVFNGKLQR